MKNLLIGLVLVAGCALPMDNTKSLDLQKQITGDVTKLSTMTRQSMSDLFAVYLQDNAILRDIRKTAMWEDYEGKPFTPALLAEIRAKEAEIDASVFASQKAFDEDLAAFDERVAMILSKMGMYQTIVLSGQQQPKDLAIGGIFGVIAGAVLPGLLGL